MQIQKVLHCNSLHCIVCIDAQSSLRPIVDLTAMRSHRLHFTAFHCILLHFTAFYCFTLHWGAFYYFTLHWGAEHVTFHLCTRFHSGWLHSCNCGSSSSETSFHNPLTLTTRLSFSSASSGCSSQEIFNHNLCNYTPRSIRDSLPGWRNHSIWWPKLDIPFSWKVFRNGLWSKCSVSAVHAGIMFWSIGIPDSLAV